VEFADPIVGVVQQELVFLKMEEIKSCVTSGTIYQSSWRGISQKTFIFVADDVWTKTLMDVICERFFSLNFWGKSVDTIEFGYTV